MLARHHRLTASKDIMRILRRGKRANSGSFTIYCAPNRGKNSRATVIISKKVDKRAVVRNRCRRRVREALRAYIADLPAGFDLLIYIRQDIRTESFQDIQQALESGIKKLGMRAS